MPELPEVETVIRDLRAAGIEGALIKNVHVHWPRLVAVPSAGTFVRLLRGVWIQRVSRRGKYIVFRLSDGHWLLMHLRMTGQLSFVAPDTPLGSHQHARLMFGDGKELRYHDPRKFGRWYLLRDAKTKLDRLGPEPLASTFTLKVFRKALAGRKGMLKPLMLNQRVLAGLGNIYVDESLWEARLHPQQSYAKLTAEEQARLYRAVRRVLRRGVAAMGTTLGKGSTNFYSVSGRRGRNQDGLRVFRRHTMPCPRCSTRIIRIIVSQRSTHLCPQCQRMET